MKLTHDGLSLWYGTPDAPAPFYHEVVARDAASLVIGAHPAKPTNSILVHYRVDGGVAQSVPGRELRVDHDRDCQYFLVTFPMFPSGDVVHYSPVLSCGGRQVPALHAGHKLPSGFRLGPKAPSPVQTKDSRAVTPILPLAPELSFLAKITVHFNRIDYLGETPEGVRIDFYADTGTVSGPSISGTIAPGAADHMYVRQDGIGVIRVRALINTVDGAKIDLEDSGSVDFGPDGYARALANKLPSQSSVVISPRILTGHPKYVWLNRVQCLGIGQTNLDESLVNYQIYSTRVRTAAHTT